METGIKKWMVFPGILGMMLALRLSPIAQTAEDLDVEEIWTHKTDTVLSVSVSEEGGLTFSEQAKNGGFIRIYNQEDKILETCRCASARKSCCLRKLCLWYL